MSLRRELISVIVPIYNSEKYLEKCLESIINQSYKNLEIILVNDGSKDQSHKICEKYALKDERIKIFYKNNGGVSSARNFGLDRCKGEFITFVDSDDEITSDMYETMINQFSNNIDIVCCGVNRITSNSGKNVDYNYYRVKKSKIYIMTGEEAMKECLIGNKITFDVYTKLFRAHLFNNQEELIRFPEGCLMEEATILPLIFKKINSLLFINEKKYNYYERENSYTTKLLSEECYFIYDTIKNYEKILPDYFYDIYEILRLWKYKNCINLYHVALIEYDFIDRKVFERVKDEFNSIWLEALLNKGISLKDKLIILEAKTRIVRVRKYNKIKNLRETYKNKGEFKWKKNP